MVWNGGRQLLGEVIRVYMNDSTIRFAQVDGQAFSVEQLPDKQHYNQVSSRLMNAYFEAGSIRQTEAIGNVRTVYYYTDGSLYMVMQESWLLKTIESLMAWTSVR